MNVYTYTTHILHKHIFLTVLVRTLNPHELQREKKILILGTQRLRSDGEVLTRGEKVGETVTGAHRVPGSLSMPAVPVLLSFFPQDEEKQKEMRRKTGPSFRISHQNGKQVFFSFSRNNPTPSPHT